MHQPPCPPPPPDPNSSGRRRAPVQQAQHPMSMLQQQMIPRGGRVYRYPPGRNMPDVGGGMAQPTPISAMATALANASPEQQRMMLGESLYPLVEQLEHESAAKVMGMLLEMDQTEVLHLLEAPEALKAKVGEAMDVLRNVNAPTDQLASLSLNGGIVS